MNVGTVVIVDDDALVGRAMKRLLNAAGFASLVFSTAEAFLEARLPDGPCCAVLDIRMPGMSGLELQRTLNDRYPQLPVVFLTGHGDIRMAVRAVQAGAMEFLTKPVQDAELLSVVRRALARHEHLKRTYEDRLVVQHRMELLTRREREVLAGVVSGLLNKQIGQQLGISEKTIKAHRARMLEKMRANSVPDLVRMVDRVGMPAIEA